MAVSRTETQRGGARETADRKLLAARTRFYPGWWIHFTDAPELVVNKPVYKVLVDNEADARLAKRSKPDFIEAEIELVEE